MPRSSEPVLAWLRTMIAKRGLNTAALAAKAQVDRNELRKALTGATPMTLDTLMAVSNALELNPADMGFAAPPAEAIASAEPPPSDPKPPTLPDPWGNHPEQLFRMGFTLGCDFFFVAKTEQLQDSGVPAAVLKSSGKDISIALDARYHVDNAPRFDERGVTLTLSFDKLYECFFPWSSVRQVIFFPAPAAETSQQPASPSTETQKSGPARPHLRLVTDE